VSSLVYNVDYVVLLHIDIVIRIVTPRKIYGTLNVCVCSNNSE